MAAPSDVTTLALSGTYILNKSLSDDTDKVLELQGVSWFLRKVIGLATITLHIKHYKDENNTERIDIKQTLTGGIEGTQENRILDWTLRTHEDKVFGAVIGKSRRIKVDEIDNEYLKNGWLSDTQEHGAINAWVTSDTEKSGRTWTAIQVWGFEEVNGERRYVRHLDFTAGKDHIQAKMIYDYAGKLQE